MSDTIIQMSNCGPVVLEGCYFENDPNGWTVGTSLYGEIPSEPTRSLCRCGYCNSLAFAAMSKCECCGASF